MNKTIEQLARESGFPVELMYDWENRLVKFGKAYMKQELEKLEPSGWDVYVEEKDDGYFVYSLDENSCIDDMTNHNAEVTPLYDLSSLKE